MNQSIKSFLGVFEQKLERNKKTLKKELKKEKKQRNREWIKRLIHENKQLQKTINRVCEDNDLSCPHCGEKIH